MRLLLFALGAALTAAPALATGPTLEWTRQLGTSSSDYSFGVAVDGAGNAYISGYTSGSLDGTNVGGDDAFLTRYNADGSLAWTRQIGTSSDDRSFDVAVDGAGNAYITGRTLGSLDGTNSGDWDAFLTRFNADGTIAWTRQLGTSGDDRSRGVAVDGAGNAYISGYTEGSLDGINAGDRDAFLTRFNIDGTVAWTRQLGTISYDRSEGVVVDGAGNIYIGGFTRGSLDGTNAGDWDAFLSRYNADGTLAWTRQLGTSSDDRSFGLAVDGAGNAYISGLTSGSLDGTNAGSDDAFLSRYNADGTLAWTRQLGTSSDDVSNGVAVDGAGNAYITGFTRGSLEGINAGGDDMFLTRYNADGTLAWTRQLGTSSSDFSLGVALDGMDNAYISGWTDGSLDGTNAGGWDTFLVKFSNVPEPSSFAMLGLCGVVLARRRR